MSAKKAKPMFCTYKPKKTEIQKPDYHGLSQEVGTCSSCASSFKRRAKAMGRKGNRARPAAVVTRAAADKAKEVATRAQKLMEEAVIAPGEIRDATKHAEVAVQGKAKAMGRKGNRARPAAVVSIENTILKNTFPVHLFDSLFLIGDPFEVFFRST